MVQMAKTKEEQTRDAQEHARKIRVLQTIVDEAKNARKDIETQWDDDIKTLKGGEKQHFLKRFLTLGTRVKSKTNILFSQMETMKPILTSEIPSTLIKPIFNTPAWKAIAEQHYTKAINRIYQRNDMRAVNVEVVDNGVNYGQSTYKITWDTNMFAGNGDIKISVPNGKEIYYEPGKGKIDNSNYLIQITRVDEISLLRRFPDREDDIRRLFGRPVKMKASSKSGVETRGDTIIAPEAAAATTTGRFFDIADRVDRTDPVELVEIWFMDDETEDILDDHISPSTGSKSQRKKRVRKRKFPNGRYIQFAGNVIFVEEENKFPGIPYVKYWNYRIDGEPYGVTELRHTAPIQKQIDLRKNQIFDTLNFNTGRRRYVGPRFGLDPDQITNAPDQTIQCNDPKDIFIEDGPTISAAMFQSEDMLKKDMETVTGVREVTQGTIPGDIRSGNAIELLQEASDVRLRGKSGELQSSFVEITRKLIDMITTFYIDEVHYNVNHIMVPKHEGSDEKVPLIETDEWAMVKDKKVSCDFFDIEIRAGVNIPRSRVAKEDRLFNLHQRGVIDDEFLIQHLQLDGKDALEERMKEVWDARREAALAEAQAALQPQEGGVPQ